MRAQVWTIVAVAIFLMAGIAEADASRMPMTHTVSSSAACDFFDIQAAIDAAASGDTILVSAETFTGSKSTFNILGKELTIIGGYSSNCTTPTRQLTVLDATGQADSVIELFAAASSNAVEIRNFVITNGEHDHNFGGGIQIGINNDLELINSVVSSNNSQHGAGVFMRGDPANPGSTSFKLTSSTIYNNVATGNGGGINCRDATVVIQESNIGDVTGSQQGNQAINGGGAYLEGCTGLFYQSSSIDANEATNGGGVFMTDGTFLLITDAATSINDNHANIDGGGFYLDGASQLTMAQGSIADNYAESDGGGVYAVGNAQVKLDNGGSCSEAICLHVHNNRANQGKGGGVYAKNSYTRLERAVVDYNYAQDNGSAIFIETDGSQNPSGNILDIIATLIARNEVLFESVVEVQQAGLNTDDVALTGVTFAYNKTTVPSNFLEDIRASGNFDLDMTGLVVWGDQSTDQDALNNGVNETMICSVVPFGWNYAGVGNTVGEDPQFRNVAGDNFRLSATSPGVDKCDLSTGSRDVDYVSRPYDMPSQFGNQTVSLGGYDAGAYEFSGVFGINGAPCAYADIDEALTAASAGDAIFGLPATFAQVIGTINKSVSIAPSSIAGCEIAAAASDRVTFDASGSGTRVVTVDSSAQVTMTAVTLANGADAFAGNVLVSNASLVMNDAIVEGGTATDSGGGLRISSGSLTLNASIVRGNSANGVNEAGGGIHAINGVIVLNDSHIGEAGAGNMALGNGGGVYLRSGSVMTMTGSSSVGFNSAENGGGIHLAGSQAIQVIAKLTDNAIVESNTANDDGGGIYVGNGLLTMVDSASVANNASLDNGGGIYVNGAKTRASFFDSVQVANNSSGGAGGGLAIQSGAQAELNTGTLVTNNSAATLGGGASVIGSATIMTMTNSSIISNTAIGTTSGLGGGGLSVGGGASVALYGSSTIAANVVGDSATNQDAGGGVRLISAGTQLTMHDQSSVADNLAYFAGGVQVGSDAMLYMLDSAEIYSNTAIQYGGGIWLNGGGMVANGTATQRPSFHHNIAPTGGAIRATSPTTLTLAAADVHDNSGSFSSGLSIFRGHVELVNTHLFSNVITTFGRGAALSLTDSSLTMRTVFDDGSCDAQSQLSGQYCSQISNNEAQYSPAIYATNSTVTLTHTAITNNIGRNSAGNDLMLIEGDDGQLRLDNVLIENNRTLDHMVLIGRIGLTTTATASIYDSTIFNNDGSALASVDGAGLTVERSIFWQNDSGSALSAGSTLSSNCNIAQAEAAGMLAFDGSGDVDVDPQFVATAWTGAWLSADSPAVDQCASGAADDLLGNQRGGNGLWDKGAFEFDASVVPTAVAIRDVGVEGGIRPNLLTPFVAISLLSLWFYRMNSVARQERHA